MACTKPGAGLLGALALLLAASPCALGADVNSPAGTRIQVEGEVVATGCYLRDGSHGPDHKNCALRCLDRGGQVGIVEDGTGALYPLASRQPASAPSDRFRDLMATHVKIRGWLYERAGSRVLIAEEIQPTDPGSAVTR